LLTSYVVGCVGWQGKTKALLKIDSRARGRQRRQRSRSWWL